MTNGGRGLRRLGSLLLWVAAVAAPVCMRGQEWSGLLSTQTCVDKQEAERVACVVESLKQQGIRPILKLAGGEVLDLADVPDVTSLIKARVVVKGRLVNRTISVTSIAAAPAAVLPRALSPGRYREERPGGEGGEVSQIRPGEANVAARSVVLAEEELLRVTREALLRRSQGAASCSDLLPQLRAAAKKAEFARTNFARTMMDLRSRSQSLVQRLTAERTEGVQGIDRQLADVNERLVLLERASNPADPSAETARQALMQLRDELTRRRGLQRELESQGQLLATREGYADEMQVIEITNSRAQAYYRQLVDLEEFACAVQRSGETPSRIVSPAAALPPPTRQQTRPVPSASPSKPPATKQP